MNPPTPISRDELETGNYIGVMDFDYSIKKAKLGDKFLESEYGRTIYGEVITEPKTEGNYLSFDAKMSDGRVVTYGGSLDTSAYWPTITKIGHWPSDSEVAPLPKPKKEP